MNLDYGFMWETFFKALRGLGVTFELTGVALLFGIPLGFIIAIINIRKIPVLHQFFRLFISFMRSTPMVVQIFIAYFGTPKLLIAIGGIIGIEKAQIYEIPPIYYAFIVFSLVEISVLAEVFRAALSTVDRYQLEAAESMGLTLVQSYRRIVIPQAIAAALPVFCSSVTDLIKLTSLAFLMTIQDVTGICKIEGGNNLAYIEAYMAMALVYLIVVWLVERIFKLAERRVAVFRKG